MYDPSNSAHRDLGKELTERLEAYDVNPNEVAYALLQGCEGSKDLNSKYPNFFPDYWFRLIMGYLDDPASLQVKPNTWPWTLETKRSMFAEIKKKVIRLRSDGGGKRKDWIRLGHEEVERSFSNVSWLHPITSSGVSICLMQAVNNWIRTHGTILNGSLGCALSKQLDVMEDSRLPSEVIRTVLRKLVPCHSVKLPEAN